MAGFSFYIQAGAYTIPAVATPSLATDKTLTNFYGPGPQAFVKLQAGKNTSFQIGTLLTLIGTEYTFGFENVNIERGLAWNQENAVNREILVNQTMRKVTASLTWNGGFYSNRYSWLWGFLSLCQRTPCLIVSGDGNLSQTKFQTLAIPMPKQR